MRTPYWSALTLAAYTKIISNKPGASVSKADFNSGMNMVNRPAWFYIDKPMVLPQLTRSIHGISPNDEHG